LESFKPSCAFNKGSISKGRRGTGMQFCVTEWQHVRLNKLLGRCPSIQVDLRVAIFMTWFRWRRWGPFGKKRTWWVFESGQIQILEGKGNVPVSRSRSPDPKPIASSRRLQTPTIRTEIPRKVSRMLELWREYSMLLGCPRKRCDGRRYGRFKGCHHSRILIPLRRNEHNAQLAGI